jgi:hypothetical protein
MNVSNINIEKIKFNKINNEIIQILYDGNRMEINTSLVNIPFGLEKEYSNYILKLEIGNDLRYIIENIEKKIDEFLNIEINTQIRKKKNCLPLLICKIPYKNNKIFCDAITKTNEFINIFKLKKNDILECVIYIDKIWRYKNNYYYKWKVNKIVNNLRL